CTVKVGIGGNYSRNGWTNKPNVGYVMTAGTYCDRGGTETMIRSMTGYGKGEALSEQGSFTVEIRSVNHRYGEVTVRMPRAFLSQENEIKRLVSTVLKRGKIDVTVQWEEASGVE